MKTCGVTDLILDAVLISSKNFHSCAVYDQGYCGQLRNNGILKYTNKKHGQGWCVQSSVTSDGREPLSPQELSCKQEVLL